MSCIYCGNLGPYADEHVLSRALAGPGDNWVLKDLVCVFCNNLFSRYERAWTSEPGVAIARIHNGPCGRTRKGQAFQFHPAEQMFLEITGDPVSYEVDLLPGIKPRFRYQIVDTGTSIIPIATDPADVPRFQSAWKRFVDHPEITIQKKGGSRGAEYRVARLALAGTPQVVRVQRRSKPTEIWWDTFDRGYTQSCHPRLSLDPFGRIRIRTRRLAEAPRLLDRIFQAGQISSPGGIHQPGSYKIVARSVYDIEKVHRAVAKTLVNYLVDRLGPTYVRSAEFRATLDYCVGGPDPELWGPIVGIIHEPVGIPMIDNAGPDRHALALSSDGLRVVGVLKLYGHFTYRVHLGAAPKGHAPFDYAIRVEYNGCGRTTT